MINHTLQSIIIKETRTESGIKISNAFNPSSDRAPTGQKEVGCQRVDAHKTI